jgi:GT2 family glycosyltransferase
MLPAFLRGRGPLALLVKAGREFVASGPAHVARRMLQVLRRMPSRSAYRRWAAEHDRRAPERRAALRAAQAALAYRPRVSILMPVYNTREDWLRQAIRSVLAQAYDNWELCIADDASPDPRVREILREYGSGDPRILVEYRSTTGHISAATNSALAMASGEFVCLMDHDDLIPEDALYELVARLNRDPALDMVYSDEDKIDLAGRRDDAAIKPDWSPEYLESCMYTAHLALYRASLAREIGGFRTGYDGAQDYDFVLRFTERTDRVAHVPRILYHWRAVPGSTAASMDGKGYVVPSGVRALQDRLARTGRTGTVAQSRYAGCFSVRTRLAATPLVSIVLPTAGRGRVVRGRQVNLVQNCVESLRARTSYPAIEIVAVDNGDLSPPLRARLAELGCRFVTYGEREFNISKKINLGASAARGEYLLLLNDDIEIVTPDWIEALLEQGTRPGVGAVGAKLLYENDTLQHAGVIRFGGLPDHVRKHFSRHDPGYLFSTIAVRNYSAVTGACMLTPSALFAQAGGFDEAYKINYSDIDYCMRLRERGLRVVYTPHAELYHFESASRAPEVAPDEIARFLARWGGAASKDPYYNTDFLNTSPPDFALRPPAGSTP